MTDNDGECSFLARSAAEGSLKELHDEQVGVLGQTMYTFFANYTCHFISPGCMI